VNPVWSLAIAAADFLASTSLLAVALGERILTRVGHYRVTSTLCDGMTTRVVSTDRLQRLVQRDFTEPSAVLMRQRPSSHAVAANNARFFRAERSIKSTPLVASLMETVNASA
jgi:hypothetical protein